MKAGVEIPERVPVVPAVVPEVGLDEDASLAHLGAERLEDVHRLTLGHALLPRFRVAVYAQVEPAVIVRHHAVGMGTFRLYIRLEVAARAVALVAPDDVAESPLFAGPQVESAREMRRDMSVLDRKLRHRMLHADEYTLRRENGAGAVGVAASHAIGRAGRGPVAQEADVVDLHRLVTCVLDRKHHAPIIPDDTIDNGARGDKARFVFGFERPELALDAI